MNPFPSFWRWFRELEPNTRRAVGFLVVILVLYGIAKLILWIMYGCAAATRCLHREGLCRDDKAGPRARARRGRFWAPTRAAED